MVADSIGKGQEYVSWFCQSTRKEYHVLIDPGY